MSAENEREFNSAKRFVTQDRNRRSAEEIEVLIDTLGVLA